MERRQFGIPEIEARRFRRFSGWRLDGSGGLNALQYGHSAVPCDQPIWSKRPRFGPDQMDSECGMLLFAARCGSPTGLCLRDLDAPALRAAVASHGVDEVVARRIFARVHRDGAGTLDGVQGLSRAARRVAGGAGVPGTGDHRAPAVGRRVREVSVPPARRAGGRGGADPAARSRGRPGAEAAAAPGRRRGWKPLPVGKYVSASARRRAARWRVTSAPPGGWARSAACAPGRSSTRSARWRRRPTGRCAGWCSWAWASHS